MAHNWTKKGIEGYRKTHGGAYPPGQEPKVDPSAAYLDTLARSKLNIAHGVGTAFDSSLVGKKPEKPSDVYTQFVAQRKLQIAGGATPTKTDIALGIVKKEKEEEKESILGAAGRHAETTAKKRSLLKSKLPREPINIEELQRMTPEQVKTTLDSWVSGGELKIKKGSPEESNIRKELEVYGDSSAMMKRALEKFSPDSDVKELLSGYSIARQALKEYQKLRKQGLNEDLAGQQIQGKYGYDLETLRGIYYVETGK